VVERGRRVLVHPSGFRQSPYADIKQSGSDVRSTRAMVAREVAAADGGDTLGADDLVEVEERRRRRQPPRSLWHASQGSSGR
jgi:error-prone DNA polymerase